MPKAPEGRTSPGLRAAGATDARLFQNPAHRRSGHRDAGRKPANAGRRSVEDDGVSLDAQRARASAAPRVERGKRRQDLQGPVLELPPVNGEGWSARSGPIPRWRFAARACSRGRSAARNEDFRPGYEPVTLTTPEGQQVRGVKKNEDLFSVQIMDTRERIQGYKKDAQGRGQRHTVRHARVHRRDVERKRPGRSSAISNRCALPRRCRRLRISASSFLLLGVGPSASNERTRHDDFAHWSLSPSRCRSRRCPLPPSKAAGRDRSRDRDEPGPPGRVEGSDPVAALWRQLLRAAPQPSQGGQPAERQPSDAPMDVPDRCARQLRDHVVASRRHPCT